MDIQISFTDIQTLSTDFPGCTPRYALLRVQGGEDSQNASSCRSFFAKQPLIIGLFCGKGPLKIGHPLRLHHPVLDLIRGYSFSFCHLVRRKGGVGGWGG